MRSIIVVLMLVLVFTPLASAALGISPAKKVFNYVPGTEHVITYTVSSDQPERQMEVYVGGDLAPYVTLSTTELVGGGSFTATFVIPDDAPPGPHRISVGVRELPPENAFIGTVIDISGAIDIFVPYPRQYAESTLSIPRGNVGDAIPVEGYVVNRGSEPLNVRYSIDFYEYGSEGLGGKAGTMSFSDVTLDVGADNYYRKFLDTTTYSPGDYIGIATIDYGQVHSVNKTFRLGSLYVAVLNATTTLKKGGLQRFNVSIESQWNERLEGVYATVQFSNESGSVYELKTPPTTLEPWKTGLLDGFVETDLLASGDYSVLTVVSYNGEQTNHTSSLLIYDGEKETSLLYPMIGLIIVALLVVLYLIRHHYKRSHVAYKSHVRKRLTK